MFTSAFPLPPFQACQSLPIGPDAGSINNGKETRLAKISSPDPDCLTVMVGCAGLRSICTRAGTLAARLPVL